MTDHLAMERDRALAIPEPETIEVYREYAAGDNVLALSEEQNHFLAGLLDHPFVDNIADALIATASDRMTFKRWKVDDAKVASFLFRLMVMNQIGGKQSDVHYAALRDGNTCVLLGWDVLAQRVTITHEEWWNGETGMFVHYTDWGVMDYAVKEWLGQEERDNLMQGVRYRTIYYPDHFERWRSFGIGVGLGGEWEDYQLESDVELPSVALNGRSWPAWTDEVGEPLGVPVVHFANANRRPSNYGESDIKNAPGYQDRMTDTQNSIQVAERLTGYQMYYSTGFTPDKDAAGTYVPPKPGPGTWHWSSSPDATFGVLPAGSLDALVKSYREKLQSIARSLRVPVHFFTGDFPSGEALLRAETMLVDRVKQRIARFGPAWATAAHRSTRIANAFSDEKLNTEAMILSEWADPERRDPMTTAAAERELFTAAETAARIGIQPTLYLKWNNYDDARLAELTGDKYYQEWIATKLAQAEFAQQPPPAPVVSPPRPGA
jgi:hypothetical protein